MEAISLRAPFPAGRTAAGSDRARTEWFRAPGRAGPDDAATDVGDRWETWRFFSDEIEPLEASPPLYSEVWGLRRSVDTIPLGD